MNYKMVSCVMLTYNRFDMCKEAIECFNNQTYPNKQLIIVDNGNTVYKHKIAEYIKDMPNIKHVCVEQYGMIGYYRNIGIDNCDGEYMAVWDDDDIYHSRRLEYEMNLISTHDVDAVMLMDFTNHLSNGGIHSQESARITMGLDGTLICKNPKNVVYYPMLSRGEDTVFVSNLSRAKYKIMVVKNDPSLYTYRFHGGNITVK